MTITPESTMAAVDSALAPALKAAENMGTVGYHELKHALTCVRQALAHAVYGAEPVPEAEAHDPEVVEEPETTDKLFS